jgi:aspartate/methionine/tyrosine aminotransferase
MPGLSPYADRSPHSGIREMQALAARVPDALNLGIGDPNFATPAHVIDAAAQAAREGFTKYTPSGGLVSLRELVVEKVRTRNGLACELDDVVVTTGGCGGLYTALLCLAGTGDEVLLPDPGWANYAPMVHAVGATPAYYPLDPARAFEPDLDALGDLVGSRTRALVVNSPGNPTGAVYGPDVLRPLVALARERGVWLVSDECYDELVFDGAHTSTATVDGPEGIVTVFTFSKSYAMTGWRVGYVVAPSEAAAAIAKAQEPVVGNASSVSQKAAEAALLGPQDCVGEMRDAYRGRRDAVCAHLDAAGVGYVRPSGAFYLMVDVSPAGASWPFARRLLEEQHVAVVPGAAFGPSGDAFVRVSLCVDPDVLREGVERLAAAVAAART